jgi:hypothetical protein
LKLGKAFAFLLLAGCVPPIDEPNPAGAAGFVTEPSPASRGEPFTTDDGWTLRFDELVLLATPGATPNADLDLENEPFMSGWDPVRWNARDRVQLFARGLRVGPWRVYALLQNAEPPHHGEMRFVADQGVDPALARRFLEPTGPIADLSFRSFESYPAAIIVLQATKGGRSVRLDLGLSRGRPSSRILDSFSGPVIEVKANALALEPIMVSAERLFRDEDDDRLEFEPFAAADASGNGDGNITRDELEAARVSGRPEDVLPTIPNETTSRVENRLEQLRARLPAILHY